ncbi:TetR/AcrR family transcriptional regulator [Nocardioides sp. HM23]|uniref:TetR/AcrR family transcriptional regulator n=1 Tax=Nocardioides bizhenqiangii TaxID=3095076 RepID=UPI002ACA36F3|nr:TetR/AcrR family transcriptional regulator [Nocardioides sp. HM23]MDZ5619234.1 TetR/AcrR family transcriptional regulator [Nocardioides sp. HM23]
MVDVARWVDSTVARRIRKVGDDPGRRSELIAAAAAAIDEEGPGVGMAQIAERAGIPRPHAYRYVASKKQLDIDVARKASADLLEQVRPHLARRGTTYEVVHGIVAVIAEWAAQHPNLYRFVAAQKQTKKLHQARMGRSRFLDELLVALSAYLRPTEVVPSAPDGVLAGLIGMVDASIIWWLDHKDETQDEVVDRLTRQVTLVLTDMLSQLGFDVPDDMVFDPGADE